MPETSNLKQPVGVVGLGLMGTSIAVELLAAGHEVKAIAPLEQDMEIAPRRIRQQIEHFKTLLPERRGDNMIDRLHMSTDYQQLQHCYLTIECVIEKIDIKKTVYEKIAAVVDPEAIIATNTSAIPITTLQQLVPNPHRFIGCHWAEPAYATRFMEITCGAATAADCADNMLDLAQGWEKDPTLLRKDIKGFITNRLMYAVYRELFHLVEKGQISIEDADKSFRYDAGSWMTLMGLFRRMDYQGLTDYHTIFQRIFPKLSKSAEVPHIMQQLVDQEACGIQTGKGLYAYSKTEAEEWEKAFARFNKDIFYLAKSYAQEAREVPKLQS